MKNWIFVVILMITLFNEMVGQTYTGICYHQKREIDVWDSFWHISDTATVYDDGIIEFSDMVFYPMDGDYVLYLGVPKDLMTEFSITELLNMTKEYYYSEAMPPTLYLHKIDKESISFSTYLRSVDDPRGFIIQTFIGNNLNK